MIEQHFPYVEVFKRRKGATWLLTPYDDLEASIVLESLEIEIPMQEIYRKVVFGEGEGKI